MTYEKAFRNTVCIKNKQPRNNILTAKHCHTQEKACIDEIAEALKFRETVCIVATFRDSCKHFQQANCVETEGVVYVIGMILLLGTVFLLGLTCVRKRLDSGVSQ